MKKFLWGLLKVSVAVGILYSLFVQVPVSDVIAVMLSAQPSYLVIALMLSILVHLVAGYRLKFFTENQGISLSTFRALEINLAAVFYGLFLPGGNLTGGAIRFYKLSGQEKKMAAALASLALDRVMATIALSVVGIFFWSVNRPPDSGYIGLSMVAVLGGLIFPALFLLWGDMPGRFLKLLERMRSSFVVAQGRKLLAKIERCRKLSLRSLIFILTLSIASHLVGAFVYYLLASSLEADISLATIVWVRSAVVLATMVPISISGLGVREGALLFLLKPYGIGRETALAFSLLVFAVTVLMMGILGGLLEGRRFLHPASAALESVGKKWQIKRYW